MRRLLLWVAILVAALELSACSFLHKPNDEAKNLPCAPIQENFFTPDMTKLGIRVIQIGHQVRIIVPADSVFLVNEPEIHVDANPGLDELATYLKQFGKTTMTITGYTDNLSSKWLAEQQARALAAYLWTRGLQHDHFTIVGIGNRESATVASNRTVNGSLLNRRVEITFLAK